MFQLPVAPDPAFCKAASQIELEWRALPNKMPNLIFG
jgi:hypothetical protein